MKVTVSFVILVGVAVLVGWYLIRRAEQQDQEDYERFREDEDRLNDLRAAATDYARTREERDR